MPNGSGKAAAWILGAIVTAALGIAWGATEGRVNQQDKRLECIEQFVREASRQNGATEASLKAIDKRLDRMEEQLAEIRAEQIRQR